MAAEIITLDPSEVATARTALEINSGAITVKAPEGVDWGDSEIQTYVAEQSRGESPVDFRIPNRKIDIPLVIQTSGTVSFNQARQKLQAKVARFQQEGGWLKRVTSNSGTVFMDVVNATLNFSGGLMQSLKNIDNEATLSLEAIPDFFGPEITLADHTETTAGELIFTESTVKGNYPGRVRIVVDEDQGQDQRGLIWSIRSHYYDAGAQGLFSYPMYEAENLTPLDTATKTAWIGASGGTVVSHASLSSSWTPVLGTNFAGSFLAHRGTYRVFARVHSFAGTAVSARLVWDVGDLVNPAENAAWTPPSPDSQYWIADFGEVRLDQAPVGPHRWQGQFQAKGVAGGEDFQIDKVWIVNADEAMGVLTAPVVTQATSTATFGPRSGGTFADVSGVGTIVWSNPGNAAASDDSRATATFTTDSLSHYLKATNFGFAIPSGATINGIVVEVERSNGAPADKVVVDSQVRIVKGGAIQATDRSSAEYWPTTDAYRTYGSGSDLWGTTFTVADINASTFGVALSAFANDPSCIARVDHIRLTVHYTPAVVPGSDAVLYASRSAQLTDKGHYRLDSGGTAYGPVSSVIGDLPRIPPGGLENRTCQVFIKASRGDLDTLPDSGIDDISARISYNPSWLFIPE